MEKKNLLKNAKKSDMKATKAIQSLSDDDLSQVSGGYTGTEGYSAGFNIRCPVCGADGWYDFNSWIESDADRIDGFQCKCGCIFGVDWWGNYYC